LLIDPAYDSFNSCINAGIFPEKPPGLRASLDPGTDAGAGKHQDYALDNDIKKDPSIARNFSSG